MRVFMYLGWACNSRAGTRVPGSQVQSWFTLNLNFRFSIKAALWICICCKVAYVDMAAWTWHHSVHAWSLQRRKSHKWRSMEWNSDFLWWIQLICWFCSNKFFCIQCHHGEHHDLLVSKCRALICVYCTRASRQVNSYPDQYITERAPDSSCSCSSEFVWNQLPRVGITTWLNDVKRWHVKFVNMYTQGMGQCIVTHDETGVNLYVVVRIYSV